LVLSLFLIKLSQEIVKQAFAKTLNKIIHFLIYGGNVI